MELPYKEIPEQYQKRIGQELEEPGDTSLFDFMNMARKVVGSRPLFFMTGEKITGWVGIQPSKDRSIENIKMFSFLDPKKNFITWKNLQLLLEILLFDIGYNSVSWTAVESNEDVLKGYDLITAMFLLDSKFKINVRPIHLNEQTKKCLYYTISWKTPPSYNSSKQILDFITNHYNFKVKLLAKEQKTILKEIGIKDFISRYQNALQ
ncbi:hypothetical protein [Treponema sp.]|uniref:hypothetical protein n=1 Tax=Treponema sp. TaxID=166 RepID=UPI003F12BDBA